MRKIDINLQPSRWFLMLITIVLLGSLIAVFCAQIPWLIKLFITLLTVFYGGWIIFNHGLLRHKKSLRRLTLTSDGWSIWDKQRVYSAELCGSSTITKTVSILRFKILDERIKRSCILFHDSVAPNIYRKLIINLHG